MGHREQLLTGAKQCLYERGYASTTARDIVAASNTNLASIGYHFGSKDALLSAALVAAFEEWGTEIDRVMAAAGSDGTVADRLEAMWAGVLESFTSHRPLWVAGLEAFALAERMPELRERLATTYRRARPSLGGLAVPDGGEEDPTRLAAGSFLLAVMMGLTVQSLIDPTAMPTASDLLSAVRAITDRLDVRFPETASAVAPAEDDEAARDAPVTHP
ncbi:TetR/AcrR family transcriptional regulator [Saccharothrix sp. 6-C]|uniref:TetR family transcriptional regulator n=1 Tax=Saccharothrix texasensis TaxID=103734 RepID=A0A3N1GZM8_9PSEU|nr:MULTISPECIES: TetR/AcrR family transcriptional regulator [Saccharothrix]QQQ80095.1 TetR/AcrR family transcriptional regulator [Saccharothrix sp. 6-C]ROP35698.1 TetR family transcriptional regulator [Saccharothrix texasensis]